MGKRKGHAAGEAVGLAQAGAPSAFFRFGIKHLITRLIILAKLILVHEVDSIAREPSHTRTLMKIICVSAILIWTMNSGYINSSPRRRPSHAATSSTWSPPEKLSCPAVIVSTSETNSGIHMSSLAIHTVRTLSSLGTEWTKRTTSWTGPDGKRSISRPYARWSDDIKSVAGNWLEEGNNREKWAEMEEGEANNPGILVDSGQRQTNKY
ncbi:hypothetical protein EVAR_86284_1 [Eumeta japonica]|uniref:Uncharacterized protein n=1 Tax=Eumeta variegata TaxID=151549 RepID=A0A4C1UCR3_EUMVA|nr:hypothetical protein EVAR_86284_1 [Eumeta japonica]